MRLLLTIFTLGCVLCSPVLAQDAYPVRPIKVVLPFAAGGHSDVVARLVVEKLAVVLKQPLVVENIAGAGGLIAASAVERAAPDGYTLLVANASTLTIVPNLQKSSATATFAFAPITTLSQFPLVLVVKGNSRFQSMADFVKVAKAAPGKLSYASPGYGTTPHLIGELLKRNAGVSLVHVPYKGGAPAMNDLLSGQVDAFFEAPANLLPQIQAGKLRPLAVTSRKRMQALPDVPTVAEAGFADLTLESWSALVAPQKTPPAVIARLREALGKVLPNEDLMRSLRERGFEATSSTPQELGHMIVVERKNWATLIKEQNITVD